MPAKKPAMKHYDVPMGQNASITRNKVFLAFGTDIKVDDKVCDFIDLKLKNMVIDTVATNESLENDFEDPDDDDLEEDLESEPMVKTDAGPIAPELATVNQLGDLLETMTFAEPVPPVIMVRDFRPDNRFKAHHRYPVILTHIADETLPSPGKARIAKIVDEADMCLIIGRDPENRHGTHDIPGARRYVLDDAGEFVESSDPPEVHGEESLDVIGAIERDSIEYRTKIHKTMVKFKKEYYKTDAKTILIDPPTKKERKEKIKVPTKAEERRRLKVRAEVLSTVTEEQLE